MSLQSLPLHEEFYPLPALPHMSISKVSLDPNIFLLKNFLSLPDEQIAMIMAAVNQGMTYSGTSSGDIVSQRFKSHTSWVYPEGEMDGPTSDSIDDDDDSENKPLLDEGDDIDDFQIEGRKVARFMTELTSFLFFPEHFSSSNSEHEESNASIAEAVQVVRYEVGGKYDMHHDGYKRFLTVLCYLNGIAG